VRKRQLAATTTAGQRRRCANWAGAIGADAAATGWSAEAATGGGNDGWAANAAK